MASRPSTPVRTSSSASPKYRIEQYAVVHDDKGYVVTFSFSPDVPAAERDTISESVLTTWKWES